MKSRTLVHRVVFLFLVGSGVHATVSAAGGRFVNWYCPTSQIRDQDSCKARGVNTYAVGALCSMPGGEGQSSCTKRRESFGNINQEVWACQGSSRNCEDFTNKCPTGYVEVPSQRLVGFSGNDILRGTGDVLCEIRSQNEQLAAPASPADPTAASVGVAK